jgi:hypothetical protein
MTTKIRTTIMALVVACSFAGTAAPAAQAMPPDCDQMFADMMWAEIMFRHSVRLGEDYHAQLYAAYGARVHDRAVRRGCGWA